MPTSKRKTPIKAGKKPPQRKTATTSPAKRPPARAARRGPLIEVRRSSIHGRGVYALRKIRKGTRIIEYVGEHISQDEADRRFELKGDDDGHTFLFIIDKRTVIDGGTDSNEARYINHHCDPNCETVIEDRRVFVEAVRTIQPGEELGYDYQLTWESTDDPQDLALYACRCDAAQCRKTMLYKDPIDKKKKKKKRKTKLKSKSKSAARKK
jgi:SET domain-containing protein